MGQRDRQFQLQPALIGMDPDGLVPPGLVGLPIRTDERSLGIPSLPPLLFGEPGVLQVLTGLA